MTHKRLVLLIGLVWALLITPALVAAEPEPEKYLKSRGLRKLSSQFVLSAESEVAARFRELRALEKKVRDAQGTLTLWEKTVDEKQKLIVAYLQQRRALRAQLAQPGSASARNRMIRMSNELADRISLLRQSKEEEKSLAAARAAAATLLEHYVEYLLQMRQLYDGVKRKYESLAADGRVAEAIDAFSQASGKQYRLGPRRSFLGYDKKLKKAESLVLTDSIKLRRGGGGLWYVPVVFNGKHVQEFAIDTGASVISIPWKVAAAIEMTPSDSDPTIRCHIADGSVVDATRMFAKTVRVGKFIAKNVECTVMPQEMTKAPPLLGLSFFKNFTFKIDAANARLVMSEIRGPATTTRTHGKRRK
jgi:clan AA aspartic protease (TIGR02281 family)